MLAETLQDFAIKHSGQIVRKAADGDEQAFSKLMSLWYKRIYNFSYKYFLNHDTAMDVTQKTFISVHKSIRKLKDVTSFRPWLYRIALNKCHEEERRSKRRKWFALLSANDDSQPGERWLEPTAEGPFFNPGKSVDDRELEELVLECLSELPEEQRILIIMKEYEGLKFREIAAALSISESTAKSRLYYGLKAMKQILEKKNFTYYEF